MAAIMNHFIHILTIQNIVEPPYKKDKMDIDTEIENLKVKK